MNYYYYLLYYNFNQTKFNWKEKINKRLSVMQPFEQYLRTYKWFSLYTYFFYQNKYINMDTKLILVINGDKCNSNYSRLNVIAKSNLQKLDFFNSLNFASLLLENYKSYTHTIFDLRISLLLNILSFTIYVYLS